MTITSSFHFYFLKSKFSFRFFSYLSNADAAWPLIWPLGHKVPESDDPTPTGPLTWLESLCLPTLSGQKPESADFIPIRVLRSTLEFFGRQFLPEKGENGASFDLFTSQRQPARWAGPEQDSYPGSCFITERLWQTWLLYFLFLGGFWC